MCKQPFIIALILLFYFTIPVAAQERSRNRLLIAWTLGVLSSVAGLAFSYRFDFSCGPSMVSIMGLVLIAAALVKQSILLKRKMRL